MQRAKKGEEGVALIEFSLVFALFVFILYALIAFGTALALKQSVTHAAAEGARAAVGVVDDPGTAEDERVEKAHGRGARTASTGSATSTATTTSTPTSTTAVDADRRLHRPSTITYPYKDKPIVPSAPGLGVVLPDTMTSTAVVKVD